MKRIEIHALKILQTTSKKVGCVVRKYNEHDRIVNSTIYLSKFMGFSPAFNRVKELLKTLPCVDAQCPTCNRMFKVSVPN